MADESTKHSTPKVEDLPRPQEQLSADAAANVQGGAMSQNKGTQPYDDESPK